MSSRPGPHNPASSTHAIRSTQTTPNRSTRADGKSSTKRIKRKSKRAAAKKLSVTKARTQTKQRVPRTQAQYLAKPEKFKDTWERVIEAISKMRSDKVSLTQAAREARVSPRTVTKYGTSALRKTKSGKYAVKKNDNLLRLMRIPAGDGMRDIAIRGSKQASLLGKYWNALDRYYPTGDASELEPFRGKSIKDVNGEDVPLLVDSEALDRLLAAGVSFESIYARTT